MNQHRTSPLLAAALTLLTVFSTSAQYPGWQQEMDCTMDITMDVDVH